MDKQIINEIDMLKVHWHQSISEINKEQWYSLTGDDVIPFLKWEWLNALEDSDSISLQSGWQPLHLSI